MKFFPFLLSFFITCTAIVAQTDIRSTWSYTTSGVVSIDIADVSPDGRRVAFLTRGDTIRYGLVDMETGASLAEGLVGLDTIIGPPFLGIIPNGLVSLAPTVRGTAIIWLRNGDRKLTVERLPGAMGAMLSTDKQRLYVMTYDGDIAGRRLRCYRTDDGTHLADYPVSAELTLEYFVGMTMMADEKHYALSYVNSSSPRKIIMGYVNLDTGIPLPLGDVEGMGYTHDVNCLGIDPYRGTILSGSFDSETIAYPNTRGASIVEWHIEDYLRPWLTIEQLHALWQIPDWSFPLRLAITSIGTVAGGSHWYALSQAGHGYLVSTSTAKVEQLPNQRYLAVGGDSAGRVLLVREGTSLTTKTLESTPRTLYSVRIFNEEQDAPARPIVGLGFRSDGQLVTLSASGMLHTWDTRSGNITAATRLPFVPYLSSIEPRGLWYHQRGKDRALTTTRDSLFMIDLFDGSVVWAARSEEEGRFTDFAMSGNGSSVAARVYDTVYVWDILTNHRVSLRTGYDRFVAMHLSPDGSELYTSTSAHMVRYDVRPDTIALVDTIVYRDRFGISTLVNDVQWSSDDRRIAVSSWADSLYLADVPAWQLRSALKDPCGIVRDSLWASSVWLDWIDDSRYVLTQHGGEQLTIADLLGVEPPRYLIPSDDGSDHYRAWLTATVAPDSMGVAAISRKRGTNQEVLYVWRQQRLVSVEDEQGPSGNGLDMRADPSTTTLTVSIPPERIGDMIHVVDVNGSIVASNHTTASSCDLDISGLASGLYLVVLDGLQGILHSRYALVR